MLGRLREIWERHLLLAIDELPAFTAGDLVAPDARA